MTDKYILNEQGEPCVCNDLIKWARWFETHARIVARTNVATGVKVSTVFLGLDHSFGGPVPLLWETMIFGGPHDQYQRRYGSHAEALTGHEIAVTLAEAGR